jgi:uncharacterized protein (DUF305 family)
VHTSRCGTASCLGYVILYPVMTRSNRKRMWILAAFAVLPVFVAVAGWRAWDGGEEATGEIPPNIVQPRAPGQPSRTLSAEELRELETPGYTDVDVAFMQGMIHHHAQALLMTGYVPRRSNRRDVALLARRMDISQRSEIELMQDWLEQRDEVAPDAHIPHGHAHGPGGRLMPGMLTVAQLARLRAAKGRSFDGLFLRSMIRHHQGALTMVARLYAANGGVEPAVDAFARHVQADQEIEIGRMRQLLAKLG